MSAVYYVYVHLTQVKSLLLLVYVIPSLAVGWASHGKAWKLSRGSVWPYAQMLESGVCTLLVL